MDHDLEENVTNICTIFGNDRSRMMDIVQAVQSRWGFVPGQAMDLIARKTGSQRVEVKSVVSFYAFLSENPVGKVTIRLCNDIIDTMAGADEVAGALSEELGIPFGKTTRDGRFSLLYTPCIGLCDQAPSALVNDVMVTRLTSNTAHEMVRELKKHQDPSKLVKSLGDGNNSHELIHSMVVNNIRERGAVIFGERQANLGLKNAIVMGPAKVIQVIKESRLRGRGGAGFSAGMKWEFTRTATGSSKVVICNADEGEPGTFKDRVILTECPDLMFEGMTIAGFAIGASSGILYLRGEYAYLRPWLEHVLSERRSQGLLGENVAGQSGFNFDIRIQMGAGAYICGEETSLISSAEGQRGDPKNRPPFPAQKGFLGRPTAVNNVETLCCASRILEKGAAWFSSLGTEKSAGTKLLSISGDCSRPGIYEVEFGVSISALLEKAGAKDARAVQVGGASGLMVPPREYGRKICFDDLATGGSIMIFGPGRNLLKVAEAFMDFFVEESCGYCTPCRVGNVLLKQYLQRVLDGKAEAADLERMQELALTVKTMSRCGLGQTSPNPILSTLQHFRSEYEVLLRNGGDGQQLTFDLKQTVQEAEQLMGRKSEYT